MMLDPIRLPVAVVLSHRCGVSRGPEEALFGTVGAGGFKSND